jgi:Terpene cyclase DEP1
MNRTPLLVVAIAFAALSIPAVAEHGITGIFLHQFENLAGIQVLADLTIALGLFIVWMWGDARRSGRNPWPWLVLTLAAGSFGPLLYLLLAKRRASVLPRELNRPAGSGPTAARVQGARPRSRSRPNRLASPRA